MEEKESLKILDEAEVFVRGHFVYRSGKHGDVYVNKDAIYLHTAGISRLCEAMAEGFADDEVDIVIGPATGGIILSQWVAHHLSRTGGREVLAVYAEKEKIQYPDPEGKKRRCYLETGRFAIKRGYDKLIANKNILVVEDVLTTAESAREVIEAARVVGGRVVGLATLFNRSGLSLREMAGVPKFTSLVSIKLEVWKEENCSFCKNGVPVNTDLGRGREFLARKAS